MKGKIIAMALVALMLIGAIGMMPVKVKAGVADNMQGGNLNVYGHPDLLYFDSNKDYHANITGLDASSGSITHAYNAGGEVNDGDYYNDGNYWSEYRWDATSTTYGWKPSAPTAGDTVVVVSEMPANGIGAKDGSSPQNNMGSGNGVNYTYATFYANIPSNANIAPDQYSWYGRYEPIPNFNATTTTVGDTWINISISLPKYTDWNDTGKVVEHRGTFDTWKSYAVFIRSSDDSNYLNGSGSYDGWYFVGNATNVIAGPDSPLPAYEQGAPTNPNTIDTGHAYLNVTGLQKESHYYVMVRMNFDFGSNHAGYGGGLGSYTTYVSSGSAGPIVTTPEFTTVLIPVVAVIGMFLLAEFVYRKKD